MQDSATRSRRSGSRATPPATTTGRATTTTQAGNLFRLFDDDQKQRLFGNIAAAMQGVPQRIIDKQLAHFAKADPAYSEGVRHALGLPGAA